MRRIALFVTLALALPAPRALAEHEPPRCPMHRSHTGAHVRASCQLTKLGSLEVSADAGLGQIEVRGTTAAVVQRDDGLVALLDIADPSAMRVVGRYDGNTGRPELDDPFDGDLAFSHDGRFLFYARQTHDFSNDGIHAIDIANPAAPVRAHYVPGGGTLRVAYHRTGEVEYVVTLDAFLGVAIFRFVRTAMGGVLVPIALDALPQLKVGGPGSAGMVIDPSDPVLGRPLLYVSTGRTGLDVYDFSTPDQPAKLGSWTGSGLADIELVTNSGTRTVYAATEHWFAGTTLPRIVELDATNLTAIAERRRFSPTDPAYPANASWRVQGLEVAGDYLYAAHSHGGLGILHRDALTDPPRGATTDLGDGNAGGEFPTIAPYAMDVELTGSALLVSDASTGTLSAFAFDPVLRHPEG